MSASSQSISYKIEESWPLNAIAQSGLRELALLVFEPEDVDELLAEIKGNSRIIALLAYSPDRLVGFKVGYERKPQSFYSWLGAVHPEFRKQGIASELMNRQHKLLKEQGYLEVQTISCNKWREMLILNLKAGFEVFGTFSIKDELRIMLRKSL